MPSVSAKKNIVIVAQLVCLAALIALILNLRQQDTAHLLSRVLLSPELANQIQIKNQQHQIELEKTDDGWQLIAPIQQAANEQRILPLLSLLTLPNVHRYSEEHVDLAQLGLAPALATVRINQQSFNFGDPDLSGKKRYLLSAGGVYLVDDLLFPLINAGPQSFAATGSQ